MGKLIEIGSAIITAATGAIVAQSGCVAGVVHNGDGDNSITLGQGGVDAAECVAKIAKRGANVASGNVSFGFVNTSDTVKQVTSVQEDAAGAASVAANVDFSITIFRILP